MGCPLFRGCLSIEVNGREIGIVHYSKGVHFSGVSIKRGVVWDRNSGKVTNIFLISLKHWPTQLDTSEQQSLIFKGGYKCCSHSDGSLPKAFADRSETNHNSPLEMTLLEDTT